MKQIETPRLLLNNLTQDDKNFIIQLVNTPDWIRFIGARNIKTQEAAEYYIQKILESPNLNYRMVRLKDSGTTIGAVTIIQRTYLDYPDIGFAFLPDYGKMGYAFEAAKAVLDFEISTTLHPKIFATTIEENENSIRLLKKLGLEFEKDITVEGEKLLLFSIEIQQK